MTRPRVFLAAVATTIAALLAGCGQQAPLKIGFIGGLSDRNSDNGQSGLNGVTLAIEQFNRNGGIDGQLVELVARDDAQKRETAEKSAQELVDAKVEAVIGPFTSGMAEVIVPITGKAGVFHDVRQGVERRDQGFTEKIKGQGSFRAAQIRKDSRFHKDLLEVIFSIIAYFAGNTN